MASEHTVYECPDGTEFPVEWPDVEIARHAWRWDQLHVPTPLTPLSQEMWDLLGDGMEEAAGTIGVPLKRQRIYAHGYPFGRAVPPDAETLELLSAVAERDSRARIDRQLELWETRYRPEVEALTRSLQSWATPDATLAELMARFDEVQSVRYRQGQIHMLVMGLSLVAVQRWESWCAEAFGEDGGRIATDSIAGMPNKSLESADGLWQLSREALARTGVATLLQDRTSVEFLAELSGIRGGPEFQALLDAYLDEFGLRNESFSELALPSWREDPRFVIFSLRNYAALDDAQAPATLHARTADRRKQTEAEAIARLTDTEAIATFRRFQRAAQARTILIEDHNYYIDQRGFSSTRIPLLAIGERLVQQDAIEQTDDVFNLHVDELGTAAANPDARYLGEVTARRADRARWMRTLPPLYIGDGERLANDRMEDFFGPDELEPAEPGSIRGVAGSAGTVRGRARLVRTLAEVDKLGPGDILVTYATAPPWTPLFAIAAGVVTDVGGALAHCAVVAREYGIPCVTGTKIATAQIEDGMMLTVDGTNGVVRIED